MSAKVATIDFHVTSECSQECPYCWGPQDFENPADTDIGLEITDLNAVLEKGRCDSAKHLRHSRGWSKGPAN